MAVGWTRKVVTTIARLATTTAIVHRAKSQSKILVRTTIASASSHSGLVLAPLRSQIARLLGLREQHPSGAVSLVTGRISIVMAMALAAKTSEAEKKLTPPTAL